MPALAAALGTTNADPCTMYLVVIARKLASVGENVIRLHIYICHLVESLGLGIHTLLMINIRVGLSFSAIDHTGSNDVRDPEGS